MSKKIIIAGGGTGGHIFPAVAIANALKRIEPGIDLLFVGAKGKMEMEKIPQAGYKIQGIDIAGFNRSSLIKNVGLPFKLLRSFFQVKNILQSFKPDAVIGVGGYSSFPVLRYAQSRKIPNFIHESNSFAGKSNILLGKNATRIFVASDGMEKFFPANKIQVTGNPVRRNIVENQISKEQGLEFFDLEKTRKTIFVTGGSLGAKTINESVDAGIRDLEKNNLQLIWQTGKLYAAKASEKSVDSKYIWANEFISQMEYAFSAADIIVSRAGAMSIAELCVVGKPVVFVPYPFAAEDHQTVNAENLVSKRAGLMIKDSEAREKLVNAVIDLSRDENMQKELSQNIAKLAVRNADEIIAKEILKEIHG
ncbi:MAG: undecaprenyldiphospho-muramoylpentapeptide beta-N-acetylglucosaminyltransferase [Bacteroidetes bacterium]|nr:MAG: undecaprenyldiphospho-muramoylpentapeptide beta-N-acetylglucosaminyltransferase [Bacteroidota bacterium]